MQLIINIPEEQYNLIMQSHRVGVERFVSKEAMMYAIKNGRVLNETEAKKVDEIINPHNYTYKNGCCSCPHSGSIIDGYRDCPNAYTEQSRYCGFYNKGE